MMPFTEKNLKMQKHHYIIIFLKDYFMRLITLNFRRVRKEKKGGMEKGTDTEWPSINYI